MLFRFALRILVLGAIMLGWVGAPVMASPAQQDNLIPLVYGQTVDGTIDTNQPSVFYQFQAAAGDVITVTMIVTSGDVDPFLVLNSADRMPLTTDDNSGGGVNARLTFVIPTDGAYIIQATHAGGIPPEGGGTFSLNLTTTVEGNVPTSEPVPAETPIPAAPTSDIPVVQGDSTRLVKLQPGETVRDTLDRQVALRFYWFEAEPGAQIMITPEQLADFQPLIVLYDAAFVEQQRAAPGAGIRTNLPDGGIYFLAVSLPDTGNAGGGYGFVFDQSANLATSENYIDIAYGESQSGNIDANIPAVTYRFSGSAGDAVTITMSRAGGDLNSYLYLLDGQGQLLYEDNDSGGDNGDARINYTLPDDGVYLILATRLGQAQGTTSGSYLLSLSSDATPPPPVAEETEPVLPSDYEPFPVITYGQTVQGELSSAKFMDIYVFLGQQGDPITVDLVSLNGDEANGLDPLVILLDDARIPLTENDDIVDGVDRNSHLEFTLPRTAYYAIVATRFDQDAGTTAGPYELTLGGPGSDETTAAPAETVITSEALITKLTPAPLAPDTASQGTFDAGGALYSFEADSGTLIDLSVTTDPGVDSILILADENLNEVLSSGTGALTGVTIPKTGQYLVILAPRFGPVSTPGGGYILALAQGNEQAAGPTGPQMMAYGDTVNGVINDDQVSQTYTFAGSLGDRVRITMEATPGSALDCYLELQGPDGAVVDANDDIDPGVVRDSLITVDLPADGTYTIVASRYVGPDEAPTAGTYRLSLEAIDENAASGAGTAPQTTPLAYGQTEVGEINDDQYLVFYVFEGTVGDVVTIQVNNLTGNLDSVLHLYRSEGDQWVEIANNDDSPTGGTYEALLQNVILPQTGKYLIVVNRYGLDRERTFGTFAITLTLEPQ
jgi:hypothetical protein